MVNRAFFRDMAVQLRFFGALFVSALLHVLFLGLTVRGANQANVSAPHIVVARLLIPQTALSEQPQTEGIVLIKGTKSTLRHTGIDKSTKKTTPSTSNERVAHATLIELKNPQIITDNAVLSTPSISASDSNSQQAPLDLSPQAISLAVDFKHPTGLRQAARDQLGVTAPSPSTVFARQIAAGAVPDCLRTFQDREANTKTAAIGGLLVLPFLAYSSIAGKCK